MEQRSSSGLTKWLLLGLAAFLFFTVGKDLIFGKGKTELQPLDVKDDLAQLERAPEQAVEIRIYNSRAVLGTRGASLRTDELTDTNRYHAKKAMPEGVWAGILATFSPEFGKGAGPIELVTTTAESRMPLRADLKL